MAAIASRHAVLFALLLFAPSLRAATFNVRDYGARGDRRSNDAKAIQAAIDACCRAGGGAVCLPPGDYLSGMIRLRTRVTLRLENGATLWASPRAEDYVRSSHVGRGVNVIYYLIVADDQEHVVLEGDGVVRGVGQADLMRRPGNKDVMPPFQIGTLFFDRCRNASVRNLNFRDSGCWTLHFFRCDEVFVEGVSIVNNYFRTVTDGIDPDSCRNVHITNCHISTGDDCICLKTRSDHPCRDVVVSNCTLESNSTAIKLGTESEGDFSDVRVDNCTIRNSAVGVGIYIKDGAAAERISFSNLSIRTLDDPSQVTDSCRNASYPIFVDIERREEASPIGAVRDLTFRNIQIHSDKGILLQGMAESVLENVRLENITLRVDRGADYSQRRKRGGGKSNASDDRLTRYARDESYLTVAHVRGLLVDSVRLFVDDRVFDAFPRSALSVHEAETGTLRSIGRTPPGKEGGQPVVRLHNCREMLVADCCPPVGTPVFLGLTGPRTSRICLAGNDLSGAKEPTRRGEGAAPNATGARQQRPGHAVVNAF